MKCESYRLKVNLKLILHWWWLDPLYFMVIWQWSLTLMSLSMYCLSHLWHFYDFLETFFIFFSHCQWFVEMFFHCLFTPFSFFNLFYHGFVGCIISSVYLHGFAVLIIITTHHLVTISTACLFLICFCIWIIIVWLTTTDFFLLWPRNQHLLQTELVIVFESFQF